MNAKSLTQMKHRLALSQSKLACALGIGRRSLGRYEGGEAPIPKVVALACAALSFGLPPME